MPCYVEPYINKLITIKDENNQTGNIGFLQMDHISSRNSLKVLDDFDFE